MNIRGIISGGMLISVGVVLPVFFHMVGLGKAFLPMHIPVFMAGLLMGPLVGAVVGAVTPLLSSIVTGMPPFAPPVAQMMSFELAVYGMTAGFMVNSGKGLYLALISAMFLGRLVAGLSGWALLPLLGFEGFPILYPFTVAFIAGLPGVFIQLVLIPPLVKLFQRNFYSGGVHGKIYESNK